MPIDYEQPYWPPKISKYSANRVKGMSMRKAALKAGYSESMADAAGRVLEPKAKQSIKEALEEMGADNSYLAKVIKDGLGAEKALVVDKQIVSVPDMAERRQSARLCLEASGELKTASTVAIQMNLPPGLAQMLEADMLEYQSAILTSEHPNSAPREVAHGRRLGKDSLIKKM